MRRWNAIAQDMAPYHPIQRGFGGSRWSDLAVHADQLITPHQFQAVVCFVANDIAGKPEDKEPQEVRELVSYFVRRLRAHDATAPIFLIPVTPTPKRWKVWPTADQANTLLRALCQDDDGLHFIETKHLYLGTDGLPRSEFFVEDQLHLNETGYLRWAEAIRSHLDAVLLTTSE
ncbi:MAG: GDSL-type esterase/lipase family protein, partial [Verrucomicrobiota bacterium]